MSKITCLPLLGCVLALLAVGCFEDPTRQRGGGTTAYVPSADLPDYDHKLKPRSTGMGANNPITGDKDPIKSKKDWTPEPKALVDDFTVGGTVSSSDEGSLTVNLDGGGTKTFVRETTTEIFTAGDRRFFAKPMPGAGAWVAISAYTKDGQDYARLVEIGKGGVVIPGGGKKK